jgi:hypothetical protein
VIALVVALLFVAVAVEALALRRMQRRLHFFEMGLTAATVARARAAGRTPAQQIEHEFATAFPCDCPPGEH